MRVGRGGFGSGGGCGDAGVAAQAASAKGRGAGERTPERRAGRSGVAKTRKHRGREPDWDDVGRRAVVLVAGLADVLAARHRMVGLAAGHSRLRRDDDLRVRSRTYDTKAGGLVGVGLLTPGVGEPGA